MSALTASVGAEIAESLISPMPQDWAWPAAPETVALFDKYSERTAVIAQSDTEWQIYIKGDTCRVGFAAGATGLLQRRLVFLSRRNASPGSVRKAATVLVRHWPTVLTLLSAEADDLKRLWRERVTTVDEAMTFKALLKLACTAEVGPWRTAHSPLVKSLTTHANDKVRARGVALRGRKLLANVQEQAAIVQFLDQSSETDDISDCDVEGAATLALVYQHGVRPVQALCLDTSHVTFYHDATGGLACVVSFHAAKQRDGKSFEIARQVRPEWVPLLARVHATALARGRSRLFSTGSPTLAWLRARAACRRAGLDLACTAKSLRHSAAQSLADAGHSRTSIKNFLGHVMDATARAYIKASLHQAELINTALGASKLYGSILSVADGTFVTREQIAAAAEEQQIGAVVGESLIAGVGLCKSGQSNCAFNPVTSCYGCRKFMPSMERAPHLEAIQGMRQQVSVYLAQGTSTDSPAYRQLTAALSGAQQALSIIDSQDEK